MRQITHQELRLIHGGNLLDDISAVLATAAIFGIAGAVIGYFQSSIIPSSAPMVLGQIGLGTLVGTGLGLAIGLYGITN